MSWNSFQIRSRHSSLSFLYSCIVLHCMATLECVQLLFYVWAFRLLPVFLHLQMTLQWTNFHVYFCKAGDYLQGRVQGGGLLGWWVGAHIVLLSVAHFPSNKLYPRLLENICFLLKVNGLCPPWVSYRWGLEWRDDVCKVTQLVGGQSGTQILLFSIAGSFPTSRCSWELGNGVWQVGCMAQREWQAGWWGWRAIPQACDSLPLLGLSSFATELPGDMCSMGKSRLL